MKQGSRGFTLIELVIVIAIIGILAAFAIPRFLDLSLSSREAATKSGVGTIRSVLGVRYAQSATGGVAATFPTSVGATDFAGETPKNALNNFTVVTALTETESGTSTHASAGFWFVSGPTSSASYGKVGAYSDPSGTVNTSTY